MRRRRRRGPVSSLTWPGCRRSKHPLVKPMRSPAAPFRQPFVEHRAVEDDLLLGRKERRRQDPRRSSASVTVAVPRLPTTTAAAALAVRTAGSNRPSRQASPRARRRRCRRRRRRRGLSPDRRGRAAARRSRGISVMPCFAARHQHGIAIRRGASAPSRRRRCR